MAKRFVNQEAVQFADVIKKIYPKVGQKLTECKAFIKIRMRGHKRDQT